jgi:hypothetical protein
VVAFELKDCLKEAQLFQVAVTPPADEKVKPELYAFGEREGTIQGFRNQWDHLAAGVQFAQEPEPEKFFDTKVDLQITPG